MNGLEQNLMLGATALALAGTLVVFVAQYVRRYGKKKDHDRDHGNDRDDHGDDPSGR
ncbi:hypothetical protein [Microbacterium terrisoli]|jgi:hypothetical protein|uniref:hypothetical protein n=1 Tax=Microbacterium terrisoli TaxID=3242192 RepID=UPI0028056DCF|nr:hypothetical protein [Microbacterium protaetiae]